MPTGLAPGDGGVYVGQADALLHFRDTGKGNAERRVLLAGFGVGLSWAAVSVTVDAGTILPELLVLPDPVHALAAE